LVYPASASRNWDPEKTSVCSEISCFFAKWCYRNMSHPILAARIIFRSLQINCTWHNGTFDWTMRCLPPRTLIHVDICNINNPHGSR
jgi:hypothetical protein